MAAESGGFAVAGGGTASALITPPKTISTLDPLVAVKVKHWPQTGDLLCVRV